MKPFYKGEIIVEEERLEELFRRIEEARREIYNCYAELEHIGILKFEKAPASESRGNQANYQKEPQQEQ